MPAGLLSSRPGPAAGVGDHAELGGEHDPVTVSLQGAPEEFLVGVGAVDLGGVDEGDTQVESPVDGPDRFGVVAAGPGVGVAHAHRAQADAGDVEGAQCDVLHGRSPFG